MPLPRLCPCPLALGLALLVAVAGCGPFAGRTIPVPPPRPVRHVPAKSAAAGVFPAGRYYADVQKKMLGEGLMRTDGGKATPFTAADLTRNFIRVALYDEYADQGGALVPRQTPSHLRRWAVPVRMALHFGATVPAAERRADRRTVGDFAARLARLTGHPVSLVPSGPANFDIFVVNEAERRALAPRLRRLVPGIGPAVVQTITQMPASTYCLVFAFSKGKESTYRQAVAVIRGEHPDLLRLSCYHEELAQGLGLANDSPRARPSIFNDDEEFALLTKQDELMLKILYDPRLHPGMTPDQARPIVRQIASDLMAGQS